MVANPATGIDWNAIKQRVLAGEKYRAISRDLNEQGTKISHVAISKRSRREGWKPDVETRFALETKTAKILETPETHSDKLIVAFGNRTPDNLAAICGHVKDGLSPAVAAVAAGMHHDTLENWIRDDPAVGRIINDAAAENIAIAEQDLQASSRRGDIQAIKMLLRHPMVRDRYEDVNTSKSGGITVILNMPDPKAVEPPTITIEQDSE